MFYFEIFLVHSTVNVLVYMHISGFLAVQL
jgi:hypothetical protein